jgi:hypothetical protein
VPEPQVEQAVQMVLVVPEHPPEAYKLAPQIPQVEQTVSAVAVHAEI